MRLWKAHIAKQEEFLELEKKQKNFTEVKIDGTCLNYRPDAEKATIYIEDLPFAEGEGEVIIVELPKSSNTYVFRPMGAPIDG